MLRSRRESHHRNGITDLNPPQLTSATKSALLGNGCHRRAMSEMHRLADIKLIRLFIAAANKVQGKTTKY
jgi:hypothetical protein